jgi:site-specific DNA-cytosine methylase
MTATLARDLGITGTDLFCGAGGTSIGAARAGVTLRMAANHNPLAIETHNTNFPDADHDCADVSQTDPRCTTAHPACSTTSSSHPPTRCAAARRCGT